MIEILELWDDDGDIGTLLAWGIHAPADFISAVSHYGYGSAVLAKYGKVDP